MFNDLSNMDVFLKNIKNIHTKCIILKMLYFQSIVGSKIELEYKEGGYSLIKK